MTVGQGDPFPSQSSNQQYANPTDAAMGQLQAQQQQSSFQYNVYNGTTADTFAPRNRREEQRHWNPKEIIQTGAQHMAGFWDNWNANPAWRTQLITGYIALGNNPSDANDGFKMFNFWDDLGKASGAAGESGRKMTPMQILAFMAGKAGAKAMSNAQSLAKDTTDTRYNIEDPATALAITTNVLTAALGRQATPDEVNRYKAAITSYDRSNPTVIHTHTDANGNTNSTSNGGASQPGEQAVVQSMVGNSAEGQAYQTNNVFDQAMKILAGL